MANVNGRKTIKFRQVTKGTPARSLKDIIYAAEGTHFPKKTPSISSAETNVATVRPIVETRTVTKPKHIAKPSRPSKYGKVLLCCIGKMENNYIREFVEHYKDLGFTNVCLYDNNDPDGERYEDVIKDYIDNGFVILKDWRGKKLAQVPSYNDCYTTYHDSYEWIFFCDIDEFLQLERCKTIQEFLSLPRFRPYNVVRVNWKQYTDSGHITIENGNYSVKKFTETLKDAAAKPGSNITKNEVRGSDIQAKTFIRTVYPKVNITSPHAFLIHERGCDPLGKPCKQGVQIGSVPVYKEAWLNHYRFKTIEEYVLNKMVRLWPTTYGGGGKKMLTVDFFFRFNQKTPEKIKKAQELLAQHGIDNK